jgi:hypothetical protein
MNVIDPNHTRGEKDGLRLKSVDRNLVPAHVSALPELSTTMCEINRAKISGNIHAPAAFTRLESCICNN